MDNNRWLELAIVTCEHAGLSHDSIEILVTWDQGHHENALYRLDGQQILKIYGPPVEWRFHTERAVLHSLEDVPEIPSPHILAAEEFPAESPYIAMTEVSGMEMADAWKDMTRDEQLTIAREIGEVMAAIHRLPQQRLASVEQNYTGRNEHRVKGEEAQRTSKVIEGAESLSVQQRDHLLRFLYEEAPEHLNSLPKLTHFDLSHHHVYLAQDTGAWQVSGIIDWAEAVLGPPEWDIVCLWHWTFNGVWHRTFTPEWEAMQVCLQTLFDGGPLPDRFARRCLAAHLHSPWVSLIWSDFLEWKGASGDIVRDLTEYLFAPEVFGASD